MTDLPPLIALGVSFAYLGGAFFLGLGLWLSVRRGRPHGLLLISIAAASVSWIEAPYDWAVYAQFPPEMPRMPSWWPLNMTWGGLPSAVPPGYIAYFVLPAAIAVWLGRRWSERFEWRLPQTLLASGFVVGSLWAFVFNAGFGAQLGVFYYGYVIEGLALWEGTKHQYPLYDTLAMGIQMMAFAYLLGRTDERGRTWIDIWADARSRTPLGASVRSIGAAVVFGHVIYLAVFAPHLATKVMGLVTVGPTEPLFEGIANQPH